jgi:phosphatidate cytidylyltransferase
MIAGMIIHPVVFGIVFLAVLVFSMVEFYRLAGMTGSSPQTITGTIIGALFFIILFGIADGRLSMNYIWITSGIIFFIFVLELYRKQPMPMLNIGITLLGILYIAIPISLSSLLIFPGINGKQHFFPWILFGVIITIWIYDSVAYFVGSAFGKHRLFERISPKKSWEGVIGGGIAAMLTGSLNALWISSLEITDWLVISGIVIVAGTFGDLVESMIKRSINLKDSGKVLPGHGGLLDRFDSYLFVVPMVVLWLYVVVKLFQT